MSDNEASVTSVEPSAETSQAAAVPSSLPEYSFEQLRVKFEAIPKQIYLLTCQADNLGNSPADRKRRKEISDELAHLNERSKTLESIINRHGQQHAGVHASAAPPAVSAGAVEKKQRSRVPANLPKFRDGKDSIYLPEEFLRRFQHVLRGHELDLEENGRRVLLVCLTDEYAEWIDENTALTDSWDTIKKAFVRQYDKPDRVGDARDVFQQMRMSPNESITQYVERFEKQMRMADIDKSNDWAKHVFQRSLIPEVRSTLDAALNRDMQPMVSVKDMMRIVSTFMWRPSAAKHTHKSGGSVS